MKWNFLVLQLICCTLPSDTNGSLLGGGGHHHHNHGHDPDHDHSTHGAGNNKEEESHHHHHHTDHQHDDEDSTEERNEISDKNVIKPSKSGKDKVSDRLGSKKRNGRKFSNAGKRRKKNFDRPFPFRIPRTSFSCRDRAPGYYAVMEADCQVSKLC